MLTYTVADEASYSTYPQKMRYAIELTTRNDTNPSLFENNSGNLETGITFRCPPWTEDKKGKTYELGLIFLAQGVFSGPSIFCFYADVVASNFAATLQNVALTAGISQTWTLPEVTPSGISYTISATPAT